MGTVEGSLEEVPHAALTAGGRGGHLVEAQEEAGFSSTLRGGGAQARGVPPAAPHASLLASLPLGEPWRGPWWGPWRAPTVLRAVAGTAGCGWSVVWVLACLSKVTPCWCPSPGLSLPTVE